MSNTFTNLGGGFRHLRGVHKIAGTVDVSTQCALVERPNGSFLFLDSYAMDVPAQQEVDRLTDRGAKVSAILNLHPYHTVHCGWMQAAFPAAKLYGTDRHRREWPDLPWEDMLCEANGFADLFADTLEFSVPAGTQLVCAGREAHFSSVLAYHPSSGTIYVDDTLSRLALPGPLSWLPMSDRLDFHPTLGNALEERAGAADDFREWAIDLGARWHDARYVCTAHNSSIALERGAFPEMMGAALGRVRPALDRHRREWG